MLETQARAVLQVEVMRLKMRVREDGEEGGKDEGPT